MYSYQYEGLLGGRGYEGDHFKRYLEIQIPIIKISNSLRVFYVVLVKYM